MPIRMDNMRSLFISDHSKGCCNSTTAVKTKNCSSHSVDGQAAPSPVSPLLQFLSSRSKSGRSSSIHPPASASVISQAAGATVVTEASDDDANWSQCSSITQVKSVSFASNASYRPTLARSDYTKEEKRTAWFQRVEFDEITQDCVKQVRKMEAGGGFKDKKYCSRGLEGHTLLGATAKKANRDAAYAAVLDEQGIQWEDNLRDDERISVLYLEVSSSCQLWAHTIGLRDHKAADDLLLEI